MINTTQLLSDLTTDLFIDGESTPSSSGATFPVENPATLEILAHVADGNADDAQRAIEAARAAQSSWGNTSPRQRADILRRAFDIIISRKDEFASLMTAEMGKPLGRDRRVPRVQIHSRPNPER
jgi:succinate-semialdehyde dehydrogenase/glutarate-semialdehyde dehydrogenase